MKKIFLILSVCLVYMLGLSVLHADAVGIGLYANYGSGSADWTDTDSDSSSSFDFEDDITRTGFGFVLDTNLAEDKLFNYRLKLGYESFVSEKYGLGNDDFEYEGFKWDNAFGFGVLRTELLRLWFGPQLGFSAYTGENPYVEGDWWLVGADIGVILGLNINPGDVVTIALEAGYKYSYLYGEGDWESSSGRDYTTETEADVTNPFFGMALIFRFGDRY